MPRKLRIEYPGATYHVMNRGNHREDIFLDDEDRQRFWPLWARPAKRRSGRCMRIASCATTFIWSWRHPKPTWSPE